MAPVLFVLPDPLYISPAPLFTAHVLLHRVDVLVSAHGLPRQVIVVEVLVGVTVTLWCQKDAGVEVRDTQSWVLGLLLLHL